MVTDLIILSVVLEIGKLDVLNKLERILFHVLFDRTFQTLSECLLVLGDLLCVGVIVDLIVEVWKVLPFDDRVFIEVFEVTLIDVKERFGMTGIADLKRFNS